MSYKTLGAIVALSVGLVACQPTSNSNENLPKEGVTKAKPSSAQTSQSLCQRLDALDMEFGEQGLYIRLNAYSNEALDRKISETEAKNIAAEKLKATAISVDFYEDHGVSLYIVKLENSALFPGSDVEVLVNENGTIDNVRCYEPS